MRITGLVWLDDIVEKIYRKHNVLPAGVRGIFDNWPKFRFVEKGHRPGENVYFACGQTDAGRYLIVFFVHRRDGRALILSARDMTRAERQKYEQK